MKTLIVLVFLTLFTVSVSSAQSCSTSLSSCYIYGSLSGSNVTFSSTYGSATFNLTSNNYCPGGRIDCSLSKLLNVTVTRLTSAGRVRLAGGTYTGGNPTYSFPMNVCGDNLSFTLEFWKGVDGSQWKVELSSVQDGQVCSSGIYFVTGQ